MTFFRHSDVVCRFGGEEFALILLDSSLAQAEARVNVLRGELNTLVFTHRDSKLGSVTFSAGIAAFPTHGSTAEELFRVADRCLYESKKQGRDRVTVPAEIPATDLSVVSESNLLPEDP
jgi:diguanylate cyclase (GGDEF)-like protein